MVRRIGFEDKKSDSPEKSTADRYLDEFRAKGRKQVEEAAARAAKSRTKTGGRKRQWVVIVFLSVWLILWTGGIIAAAAAFFQGQDQGFLAIWITFATLGWFFAVFMLRRLLRGRELTKSKDS
ncbi:MAG: hypothetical protein GY947_03140 [Rhodobacteraceae bacterium]|nr:hypothetical protein [Paracoccaceae bacterium]